VRVGDRVVVVRPDALHTGRTGTVRRVVKVTVDGETVDWSVHVTFDDDRKARPARFCFSPFDLEHLEGES